MPLLESRQATVLVVEDDEPTRLGMACTLTQRGYLVLTAASGHDALETLRTPLAPIDVVLLDVRLPDLDGTDLCAWLRKLQPDLPVIACTGEADQDEVARLFDLGVSGYFRKPVSAAELLAAIEAVLMKRPRPSDRPSPWGRS
jgi:DNA-binding response OmpR family regulator